MFKLVDKNGNVYNVRTESIKDEMLKQGFKLKKENSKPIPKEAESENKTGESENGQEKKGTVN